MVKKLSTHRNGFTMIELIFAIVVIAITVISLPMMTQITNKGSESALVQEAIFAASAELLDAFTLLWDRDMLDPTDADSQKVINLSGDCDAATFKRPGHAARACLNDLSVLPYNDADSVTVNLHNAAHGKSTVFAHEHGYAEAQTYKQVYTSELSVGTNGSFGSLVNDSNIKTISLSSFDENDKLITRMEMYKFNIGGIVPYKRNF